MGLGQAYEVTCSWKVIIHGAANVYEAAERALNMATRQKPLSLDTSVRLHFEPEKDDPDDD